MPPIPDARVAPHGADPAEIAEFRESILLTFVTALQHLPARQPVALILCEVLRWQVTEGRAVRHERARGQERPPAGAGHAPLRNGRSLAETLDDADAELLARYVDAFERYDIDQLVTLLHEDAVQSMPPFEMGQDCGLRLVANLSDHDLVLWLAAIAGPQPGVQGCGDHVAPSRNRDATASGRPAEAGLGGPGAAGGVGRAAASRSSHRARYSSGTTA